MTELVSYPEAMARISSLSGCLGPASSAPRSLSDCLGLRLAEDLVAPIPSPPFSNAAMDGYAIRYDDLEHGALSVLGTCLAGGLEGKVPYTAQGCVKIMTGAPVPPWADTVVPIESTSLAADGRMIVQGPIERGAYIRVVGEDLAAGTLLLKKGALLRSEEMMVAAALGLARLSVFDPLRVRLLSTGSELTELGSELKPGMIYNSSRFFLRAAAQSLGLRDIDHVTIGDVEGEVESYVQGLLDDDRPTLLISTGAVSAGDADFIPRLAPRLGFATLLHKVAIRPGKPVYLAQGRRMVWLGLAGNPISTAVGWYFLARPLLSVLAGHRPPLRQRFILRHDLVKPEALRCFYRAEVSADGRGVWVGSRQGSAHFAATLGMGAYVELPEGQGRFSSGSVVYGVIPD